MLVNSFTSDAKYSLLNRENLKEPIWIQLSQKQKILSQFLVPFFKSRLNFDHFQKKITLIADVFRKLRTPKNVLNQISKKYPL